MITKEIYLVKYIRHFILIEKDFFLNLDLIIYFKISNHEKIYIKLEQ